MYIYFIHGKKHSSRGGPKFQNWIWVSNTPMANDVHIYRLVWAPSPIQNVFSNKTIGEVANFKEHKCLYQNRLAESL